MDVLRGFVLLGILVMNIQSFAMPLAAYVNPTAYGDLSGPNFWVWVVSHVFFDQKFMAIFAMLFGAGIVLMSERAGALSDVLHRRRMTWLIVFGLLHAYLLWYGDILVAYGLCGLLAYIFRDERPSVLIRAAVVLFAVGSLLPIALTGPIPADRLAQISAIDWKPTADVIASEVAAYRGGWIAQATHRVPEALKSQTLYFVVYVFWRVLGLMLLGMALFRLDVFSARRPARTYVAMAAAGFATGLPIIIMGVRQNFARDWSAEYSMIYGGVWNYWGSLAMACGYVGLVMWIVRSGVLGALRSRLAAVGRLAFTNYILQTILATTIFYGHGLGLFGSIERTGQFAITAAICTLQLLLSPIWLRHYRFGPLEWGWRRVTYGGDRIQELVDRR